MRVVIVDRWIKEGFTIFCSRRGEGYWIVDFGVFKALILDFEGKNRLAMGFSNVGWNFIFE